MIFTPTILAGSYVIEPEQRHDERGWFMRTFCQDEFEKSGLNGVWVQLNHSFTTRKGTVRGMHFQQQPDVETKLVRCIQGRIWDVIVDLREQSSTYLQWFGVELNTENRLMIYVPEGFAHGFQALTDNVELIYHHSSPYSPENERGVKYNDPSLNIEWPLPVEMISIRDNSFPLINDKFKSTF